MKLMQHKNCYGVYCVCIVYIYLQHFDISIKKTEWYWNNFDFATVNNYYANIHKKEPLNFQPICKRFWFSLMIPLMLFLVTVILSVTDRKYEQQQCSFGRLKWFLKIFAKRNESRLMIQFRSSLWMEGGGFDVDEMNESNRESYAIINASMHNFE